MQISLQVFLAFLTALLGFGSDWDRFRGPNGSGVNEARGLPVEFGVDKNMRWRVARFTA